MLKRSLCFCAELPYYICQLWPVAQSHPTFLVLLIKPWREIEKRYRKECKKYKEIHGSRTDTACHKIRTVNSKKDHLIISMFAAVIPSLM
jgi:hypothetical protein